jgi:hypothetical protein
VLAEFEPRPSGLVLPRNQVVQRFDGTRISRVAWKIVRGLHFHHHNNCLPENLTTGVSVTVPDEEPPEHFKAFMGLPNNEEHGQYPATDSAEEPRGRSIKWGFSQLQETGPLAAAHVRILDISILIQDLKSYV